MLVNALEFPLVNPLEDLFRNFINFFADEGEGGEDADKTDTNEGAKDDDTIGNKWDNDEDEEEDGNEDEDDSKKDKKEDKKEDKSDDAKKSSAIIQKQKYRQKLKDTQAELKKYKDKEKDEGGLSTEEKKEKQANEYLAKKIREVLKELDQEKTSADSEAEERFDAELEEILEDNSDVDEKQILDVCEELECSPKQALKIIRREAKFKGKKKPDVPNPKRGSSEVHDDGKKDEKGKTTFDTVARSIKEKIRKGLL